MSKCCAIKTTLNNMLRFNILNFKSTEKKLILWNDYFPLLY